MKITKKIFVLCAMLMGLSATLSAQNWTWTGETPTAAKKFAIQNTANNMFLVNTASAPLSDNPFCWTTQQINPDDGTWSFVDDNSTPYSLYVYCTKTAATKNANNFKATIAADASGLTGLAENNTKYYSNVFWVKSNNGAYSFNAYLNYGGLGTQKGDIYVQSSSASLGTATSASNSNLWKFYSEAQVTLITTTSLPTMKQILQISLQLPRI